MIGVGLAAYRNNKSFARTAFIYAVVFLSLGLIQKQRAENALYILAQQRGHQTERVLVKPSFGNRHVWKLIYEYNGRYYVDAVKVLWETKIIEGSSIKKLNIANEFGWLDKNSMQAKDIERFRWFSDDFLAVDPKNKNVIIDMRYSFLPNKIKLMWGIELNKNNAEDTHVKFLSDSKLNSKMRKQFMKLLF